MAPCLNTGNVSITDVLFREKPPTAEFNSERKQSRCCLLLFAKSKCRVNRIKKKNLVGALKQNCLLKLIHKNKEERKGKWNVVHYILLFIPIFVSS